MPQAIGNSLQSLNRRHSYVLELGELNDTIFFPHLRPCLRGAIFVKYFDIPEKNVKRAPIFEFISIVRRFEFTGSYEAMLFLMVSFLPY